MLSNKHKYIIWIDTHPFEKLYTKYDYDNIAKRTGIHICFPQNEFSINDISGFYNSVSNDKLFAFIPKINQYIQFNITNNTVKPTDIHYMLNQHIKYASTNLHKINPKQLLKKYSQILSTIDKWKIVHGDWWFFPYDLILKDIKIFGCKVCGKQYIKSVIKNTKTNLINKNYLKRYKILEKHNLLPPPHLSEIQEYINNANEKRTAIRRYFQLQQWEFEDVQEWLKASNQYAHHINSNGNCNMASKYDELKKYNQINLNKESKYSRE